MGSGATSGDAFLKTMVATSAIAVYYFKPGSQMEVPVRGAAMRIDLYTKTIFTLIALLLAVIALKPAFQPQPVMADGNFAHIQFSYSGGNHAFFDTRSGDVWEYGDNGNFRHHYKVHELGKDHDR
jgi:hypothetical protein